MLVNGVTKLNIGGEKVADIENILSMGYVDIQLVSDSIAIYYETERNRYNFSDDLKVLVLNIDGEFKEADINSCRQHNGTLTVTYVEDKEIHTVLNINKKSAYKIDGVLVRFDTRVDTNLIQIMRLEDCSLIVIVTDTNSDDALLISELKEPPLTAVATIAKTQFITTDNTLYGLTNDGKLLISKNSMWERLDGKPLYIDF